MWIVCLLLLLVSYCSLCLETNEDELAIQDDRQSVYLLNPQELNALRNQDKDALYPGHLGQIVREKRNKNQLKKKKKKRRKMKHKKRRKKGGKKKRKRQFGCTICGKSRILAKGNRRRTESLTRIVGGINAKAREVPWQVGLVMKGTNSSFCGGSVVSLTKILTAAHCYKDASGIEVVGGKIRVAKSLRFAAKSFIVHPRYNPNTQDNDFAIITLETPIKPTRALAPVCLPNDASLDENQSAMVSGWGHLKFLGSGPTILQRVNVRTMTNKACTSAETQYTAGDITGNMLCAANPGKDSCQGDSGGPLVVKLPKVKKYVQIGVVSFGLECALKDAPGVYSRVSTALNWIQEQIGNDCPF